MASSLPPRPPSSPQPWWRQGPSWALPLALFAILGLWLPMLLTSRTGDLRGQQMEVPWTQFATRLDAAQFTDIRFDERGTLIEGRLVRPIDTLDTRVATLRARLPVFTAGEVLARIERVGTPVQIVPVETSWVQNVLGWLPTLFLIGVVIWFARSLQQGGMGKTAQSFGRLGSRMQPEVPQITLDDVAGADEAKHEIAEIVDFLRDPAAISRLGGRLPKGALLIGPAGTGKTLLAKAAAGTAKRPFFSLSGSDFVEMFVGVGASRVRDLFQQARAAAPCIVFIDEIDAVGRQRSTGVSGGGGNDEREQTLNQLLVEMDGFQGSEGIVVIAATNRPDILDAALLRPGRFDRHIHVSLPDAAGRRAILARHAKQFVLDPGVELEMIARQTAGMAGADLANLLNEAAVLAARRGAVSIEQRDLDAARDKITLGLERTSMTLSDAERRLTAVHEAGHAVMALTYPTLDPLHKISIIPRGRALGITASLSSEDRHSYTKRQLEELIVMLMGGRAAEAHVFGQDQVTTGAQNDLERATSLARRMVTQFGMSARLGPIALDMSDGRTEGATAERTKETVDAEVMLILQRAMSEAQKTVEQARPWLDQITAGLLDRETLGAHDLLAMLGPSVRERLALSVAPVPPPPSRLGGETPGAEGARQGAGVGASGSGASATGPDSAGGPQRLMPLAPARSASASTPADPSRASDLQGS